MRSVSQNADLIWQQMIDITQQMLEAAQKEEWDELARIEAERRKFLYTFIPNLPQDQEGRVVALQTIQQLLEIDHQVIALCQGCQQSLASKIQSLRIGERARQAYRSI